MQATRLIVAASIWFCRALFCCAMLLMLGSVLVLSWHALPVGDDLCRAAAIPSHACPPVGLMNGRLHSLRWSYDHWTGRLGSQAIELLLLSIGDPYTTYRFSILTFLLVGCLSAFFFLRNVFLDSRASLYVLMVGSLVFWSGLPSTAEGIFWLCGHVEYMFGVYLMAAQYSIMMNERLRAKGIFVVVCIVLASCVPLIHELTGVINIAVCGVASALCFARTRTVKPIYITVAMASLAATIVVLAAPGNAERALAYSHRAIEYANVMQVLFDQLSFSLGVWMTDIRIWLFYQFLLFTPILDSCPAEIQYRLQTVKEVAVVVFACMCTIVAIIVLVVLARGGAVPGRVLNIVFFVFLVCIFILALSGRSALSKFSVTVRQAVSSAALFGIALASIQQGNSRVALGDIVNGRIEQRHASVVARHRALALASTQSNAVFVDKSQWPPLRSYMGVEFSTSSNDWLNRCAASYYSILSIVGTAPPTKHDIPCLSVSSP